MDRRLARPISRLKNSDFILQGLFRTEPRSFETSGGSGCPRPWSAKATEGCMRLRLYKLAPPFTDAICGEVWAEIPTYYREKSTSVM